VQSGITVLEDDVEIQTLTSVDRATIGETRVKRGAKIDSLCQIGHACVVGEDNIICGQTGLAGSTVLEENVIMAGQTGSSGHLTIHKNAIVWAHENQNNGATAVLHAYDATNLAHELYNTTQATGSRDQFGAGNKFITPTVAGGKVFVGTTNSVAIFGLLH